MKKLSRERLEEYAEYGASRGFSGNDLQTMAQMLLAGMDNHSDDIAEKVEPVRLPYKLPDGCISVPIELLEELSSAANFEKVSYAAAFNSHIDTGRWKEEYEELERVCRDVNELLSKRDLPAPPKEG